MPKIGFSLLEEYARKKQGSVNPLGIIARMVSKVYFFLILYKKYIAIYKLTVFPFASSSFTHFKKVGWEMPNCRAAARAVSSPC